MKSFASALKLAPALEKTEWKKDQKNQSSFSEYLDFKRISNFLK